MQNGLSDELLTLFWLHNADPDLAIESVRDRGYSPDDIRGAIEQLIEDEKMDDMEAIWLERALSHYTVNEMRSNPEPMDVRERLIKKHPNILKPECGAKSSQGEVAIAAFWELRPYSSGFVKLKPSGWHNYYREGIRDEVEVNYFGVHDRMDDTLRLDQPYRASYKLWGSELARLVVNENVWRLYLSDAGWNTPFTHQRLDDIISAGRKIYGDKLSFGFTSIKNHSTMLVGWPRDKPKFKVVRKEDILVPERWCPNSGVNTRWDLHDAKDKFTGQWLEISDADETCDSCARTGKACECQEVIIFDKKTGDSETVDWTSNYDDAFMVAMEFMQKHPKDAWKEVPLPREKAKTSWELPRDINQLSLHIELPPIDWPLLERTAVECAEKFFWNDKNGQVGQFISYTRKEYAPSERRHARFQGKKGYIQKPFRCFGFIGLDEVYKRAKFPPTPVARINGDMLEFGMGQTVAPNQMLTIALNGVLAGGRDKWPILREYVAIQQARSEKVSRIGHSAGVILGGRLEGMGIDYTEQPKVKIKRESKDRDRKEELHAKLDEYEYKMEDYRLKHPGSPSDYRNLCILAGIESEYLSAVYELDLLGIKKSKRKALMSTPIARDPDIDDGGD